MEENLDYSVDDLSMEEILHARETLGAEIQSLNEMMVKAKQNGDDITQLVGERTRKEELFREIMNAVKEKLRI